MLFVLFLFFFATILNEMVLYFTETGNNALTLLHGRLHSELKGNVTVPARNDVRLSVAFEMFKAGITQSITSID